MHNIKLQSVVFFTMHVDIFLVIFQFEDINIFNGFHC